MKDAVERVLCVRMAGQIIENFWRGRLKWRVGKAHIRNVNHAAVAVGVPRITKAARAKVSCSQTGTRRIAIPPSENRSLNEVSVVKITAPGNEIESVLFRTNSSYRCEEMGRRATETTGVRKARTIWSPLCSTLSRSITIFDLRT